MRYALLICTDETAVQALSPEEGAALSAEFTAWSEEMERTGPAAGWRAPATDERCHDRAGARRRGPHRRRALRRDQGADGRLLPRRLQGPRRGHRGGVEDPRRPHRDDRGEADLGDVVPDAEAAVAAAFRDEWGRIVATLIRVTGDYDLAEECAQDAFARAIERWPRDGVPRNPGAWLTTTARNRAVDRVRRAATGAAKLQEVAVLSPSDEPTEPDDSGVRRRPAAADLHLLPPGAGARGPGRAHAAHSSPA